MLGSLILIVKQIGLQFWSKLFSLKSKIVVGLLNEDIEAIVITEIEIIRSDIH